MLEPLPISNRQKTQIMAHKTLGNAAYKTGDFGEAETHYTTAIQTLRNEFSDNLAIYSHGMVISLYLNRAQTRLKTGDYRGCIDDATYIINQAVVDSSITQELIKKGLSKRAEAMEGLEKYVDALADHRRLQSMGWEYSGAGISRCLKALEAPIKRETNVDFDPFGAGDIPVQVKPVAVERKPDPSVAAAVNKAVTALRDQNAANDNMDALKLSLKDDVDAVVLSCFLIMQDTCLEKGKRDEPTCIAF
jgi:tetratricopeptide (TPR) repeat protein